MPLPVSHLDLLCVFFVFMFDLLSLVFPHILFIFFFFDDRFLDSLNVGDAASFPTTQSSTPSKTCAVVRS